MFPEASAVQQSTGWAASLEPQPAPFAEQTLQSGFVTSTKGFATSAVGDLAAGCVTLLYGLRVTSVDTSWPPVALVSELG